MYVTPVLPPNLKLIVTMERVCVVLGIQENVPRMSLTYLIGPTTTYRAEDPKYRQLLLQCGLIACST